MKSKVKILRSFFRYLQMMNYSTNTINTYEVSLNIFFNFMILHMNWNISIQDINIFELNCIQENDIIAFICYLAEYRKCSPTRRHNILACLHTFFKWVNIKYPSLCVKNPIDNLMYISPVKKLPKYLSFSEAAKLQNIFTEENCRASKRNNAILSMFLQTGLRLSELISINTADLNFSQKMFRVIGKGNKERICYLTDDLVNKLTIYLQTRNDDNPALFVTSTGKRLKHSTIEHMCQNAYVLAGIGDRHYTVHTLRHTMATCVYSQTKDILVVKEILGHSSIQSTQIYLHVANDELLKEAVERNPLSNFSPMDYREEVHFDESTRIKRNRCKTTRCTSGYYNGRTNGKIRANV